MGRMSVKKKPTLNNYPKPKPNIYILSPDKNSQIPSSVSRPSSFPRFPMAVIWNRIQAGLWSLQSSMACNRIRRTRDARRSRSRRTRTTSITAQHGGSFSALQGCLEMRPLSNQSRELLILVDGEGYRVFKCRPHCPSQTDEARNLQ